MCTDVYYGLEGNWLLGFFASNNKITFEGCKLLYPLDDSLVCEADWLSYINEGLTYNQAVSLIVKKTLWVNLPIVYDATLHTIINKWYEEGYTLSDINNISDEDIDDILWDIANNIECRWCLPSAREIKMGKILDE
jgi:hypothetical protein